MASQQRGELGPDAGERALVDLPAEEPADAEGEPMEVFLRCAPHVHLLPCHSFGHTNLKSPCA